MTHSCLDGEGIPELELTYSIPGVKDLLWIWVKIPDIGDNKLKCSVIDPGTWETNINSKYTCGAAWLQDDGHGRNPMPKVKLQLKKTEVVEDGGNAQEIMEKYCTKNQPNCDFTGAKRKLVPSEKSDWKVLDVYNNCGPDKKEVGHQTWAKERKFGWENSVGLSFEGEVEIPETKFNIGGEFELEGAWEFTNSYENEIDNPVPWGYANIFYLQVNYLEVTGDVDVVTKDKNYRLKNITYKLPSPRRGRTSAGGPSRWPLTTRPASRSTARRRQ
ncbi:hypothetical protein [Leucobacter soli]|uniref:hypothetical protein n=1 Tax=Leucobacter soli TaxID=2812850 RepID=UPI0036174B46